VEAPAGHIIRSIGDKAPIKIANDLAWGRCDPRAAKLRSKNVIC
jgi:hypothetical protein